MAWVFVGLGFFFYGANICLEVALDSRASFSQEMLELGEDLFNQSETGATGRNEQQAGFCVLGHRAPRQRESLGDERIVKYFDQCSDYDQILLCRVYLGPPSIFSPFSDVVARNHTSASISVLMRRRQSAARFAKLNGMLGASGTRS